MVLDKLKSILVVVFTQIVAYIFLFLIAPTIDDILSLIMYVELDFLIFIGTVIIYVISFVKFPTNLLWWLLGIPLMWKLIMMYNPMGLYGIREGGALDFSAVEIDAALFVTGLFFLQCVIKLVLFIKEVIRRKIYPM